MSLKRIVSVRPGYDCIRNPCGKRGCGTDLGSNHGVHAAELHMKVQGPDADITLMIFTGWDLPSVPSSPHRMTGALVEFHSRSAQYDEHEPVVGECSRWDTCYLNTSFSMADVPAALLVSEGSDAVWEWMEREYVEAFGAKAGGDDDE